MESRPQRARRCPHARKELKLTHIKVPQQSCPEHRHSQPKPSHGFDATLSSCSLLTPPIGISPADLYAAEDRCDEDAPSFENPSFPSATKAGESSPAYVYSLSLAYPPDNDNPNDGETFSDEDAIVEPKRTETPAYRRFLSNLALNTTVELENDSQPKPRSTLMDVRYLGALMHIRNLKFTPY